MTEFFIDRFCPSCGAASDGSLCPECTDNLNTRHDEIYDSAAPQVTKDVAEVRPIGSFPQGEIVQMLLHLALHDYNYSTTSAEYGVPIKYLKRWSNSADIERPIGALIERAIEKLLLSVPEHEFPDDWAKSLTALIKQWVTIQDQMYKRTELLMGMSTEIDVTQLSRVVARAQSITEDAEFKDVPATTGS